MSAPRPSEITPRALFDNRRRALMLAAAALPLGLPGRRAEAAAEPERATAAELAGRYNNYLEFSSNKEVVWKLAEEFNPLPWTLTIDGEVEHPRTLALDELLRLHVQEDRLYRLRCVEGWSLVVPWHGMPLAALLRAAGLTSRAKYAEFTSVLRPSQMVGQRGHTLRWPYTEALRIDEAMHPLTLLASGAYGQPLPVQQGAPLRLAVPWKYGFKSIKAIARIRLVEAPPATSWAQAAPAEYGFYGNVNPEVPHPRWTQSRELRLGELGKRPTLAFNGYAAEVAGLYAGMDLARHF